MGRHQNVERIDREAVKPMKILSAFIFVSGLMIASCATELPERKPPRTVSENLGMELFTTLSDLLASGGDQIDYDTLLQVYQTMITAPCEIAHMDRLMTSLIRKRNPNPRIDQMILIFSAKLLGRSNYPVPDVYVIFESIIADDDRLSHWVMAFVAEAIEDYRAGIPEGDKLMDLVEKKIVMLSSTIEPRKEYFGFHFLPPPRGDYIRSYIRGIQSRNIRESERNHYYLLISAGYTESDIEAALRRLLSRGIPTGGSKSTAYLKHLSQNREQIHRR